MGFDLSGKNPKMNIPEESFRILCKYNKIERFDEKHSAMDEAGERDIYWEEYNEFEAANPGVYFRNNCWWWRPLWDFVCNTCEDFLTPNDMERGSYNDGHLITKVKSKRIAVRLNKLLKSDDVRDYALSYMDWKDSQDEDSFRKDYPFSEKNVERFARFCEESGGFWIC